MRQTPGHKRDCQRAGLQSDTNPPSMGSSNQDDLHSRRDKATNPAKETEPGGVGMAARMPATAGDMADLRIFRGADGDAGGIPVEYVTEFLVRRPGVYQTHCWSAARWHEIPPEDRPDPRAVKTLGDDAFFVVLSRVGDLPDGAAGPA